MIKLKNAITETKNMWLMKLYKDLQQSKYNLKKHNLYQGAIKDGIENLLTVLKSDYDLK